MSKIEMKKCLIPVSMIILFPLAAAGCAGSSNTSSTDGQTDFDGPETHTCTDMDGDGHGSWCEAGGDCDDTDPDHWSDCSDCNSTHAEGCGCGSGETYPCYEGPTGTLGVGKCRLGQRRCILGQLGTCEGQVLPDAQETCDNGIDDNCNGLNDDEEPVCSDCAPPCYTEGEAIPSPDDSGSSGLVPNPDGPGVILGSSSEQAGFAWIANTGEGTVSKLDIATGAEVGRFRVGLTGTGTDAPSRTAIDDYQNAYVANRAFETQGSATKIAGIERYCIDRNLNGVIDTSHGSTPLDLGQDECVLWTSQVGGVNAVPRALVIDFGHIDTTTAYPWVGCFYEQRFYQLDPADGTILDQVDVNVHPYGAAIDSEGWIWISGRESYAIQRFHYVTKAVEPAIAIPSSECGGGNNPYGITIDRSDRVWVGILPGSGACRYDDTASTWFHVGLGGSGRGVAVDEDNNIWASNYDTFKLHRFAADDGSGLATWDLPGAAPAVGVGVDRNGLVWTVAQGSNSIARYNPSTSAMESFPVGQTPYTYSDFLGFQRWLMMPNGLWIGTFERCDQREGDKWLNITWDTETPDDSKITIKARSADTMGGILSAPEVVIATIGPYPDVGSADLEEVYSGAGETLGRFIEITVIMQPSSATVPVSPVFKGLQLFYYCFNLG
jgi:DNA-binding beta-propeller fold protein YncE